MTGQLLPPGISSPPGAQPPPGEEYYTLANGKYIYEAASL